MKIRTRMLALVLVLSFLLGLCGCLPVPTVRKGETAPEEELQTSEAGLPAREEAIETLAADGYLTPLAREALSFDGRRRLVALPSEGVAVPDWAEGVVRRINGREYVVFPR